MFELEHDSQGQPARLILQGSLSIAEVAQARDLLLAVLAMHPQRDWQLELSALEDIDSAGAQLLLSLHKHLAQQHCRLTVSQPNAQVLQLFELLRLQVLYPDILPAQR